MSIGLPVRNGARFLAEALDSLLAQTYRDFELIVSDNASTDETASICARYAGKDARIRYVRHAVNIGAPRNWSFVVTLARGRYFKWASCNDRCPEYMLERCVAVLERRPDAVLCYGRTCLVDEESGLQQPYGGNIALEHERPSERFIQLLRLLQLNNPQCGLIRLEALRQTGLDRPYPGGDLPLMSELALRGTFVLLPEVLLYRRMGAGTFSHALTPAAHNDFFGKTTMPLFDILRRHRDHALGVLRAPIATQEEVRSLKYLARAFYWDLRCARTHYRSATDCAASGRSASAGLLLRRCTTSPTRRP
ncbi:MAG: glycosyltransferase [Sutterellaceae bacterium]|nr:glycosyltransferase [Burkholderiaceae bacterium]MDW8429357.1 glycosyltransferase [Sutterellaceae bacterium]